MFVCSASVFQRLFNDADFVFIQYQYMELNEYDYWFTALIQILVSQALNPDYIP